MNPNPMLPSPWVVKQVRRDMPDVFTVELAPQNRETGFSFEAGQFNMLYVFGTGEIPLSICGDPAEKNAVRHTTRAVGAVTRALGRVKAGGTVGVRGPFGNPWPVAEARGKDVVLVAGGMGLAPLKPVLHQLVSERKKYGKIVLIYGTRTREEILYRKELLEWQKNSGVDVLITVDRADKKWKGNVGVLTLLIGKAPFNAANAVAMVCGPEIMMRFAIRELEGRGMAAKRIYLSMERNMKCAVGFCGHCMYGPEFICKNGPVFPYERVKPWFVKDEI